MRASAALRPALLVIAATALVAPTLTASAVGNAPRPSEERAKVKTVTRSYGGGTVGQNSPDQWLRINFKGKLGDLVTLTSEPDPGGGSAETCEQTELWRLDKNRRITQRLSGLWRLPKDGKFTMTYRQKCARSTPMDSNEDPRYNASVQLTKVLPHAIVPGGAAVNLPLEKGYLHAAVLTVPVGRAVRVDAPQDDAVLDDGAFGRLFVPGSMRRRTGPDLVFHPTCRAVSPVLVQTGKGLMHSPQAAGGEVLLFPVTYCDDEVRSYVGKAGDEVWFLSPRVATVATAAYVD